MQEKYVKCFPQYNRLEGSASLPMADVTTRVMIPNDPIIETIFSPNPQTGIPRSDLRYLTGDLNPEVSAYVTQRLHTVHPPKSVGAEDPDTALATAPRSSRQSKTDYAKQLTDQIQLDNPKQLTDPIQQDNDE